MAGMERMTAEEVVRRLLEDPDGADLVRDSLRWLVQQWAPRWPEPSRTPKSRRPKPLGTLAEALRTAYRALASVGTPDDSVRPRPTPPYGT
jgi:hypothetical protein